MSFRKKLLFISSLALVSLPVISHADLVTTNNTDEISAVRISSNGICTGNVPGEHYTNPHSTNRTTLLGVKLLCGAVSTCDAVMYSSLHCDAGTEIAKVSLSIPSLNVTVVNGQLNSHYKVSASGSNVSINYA